MWDFIQTQILGMKTSVYQTGIQHIMHFETKECTNPDIVKELFAQYSHIKGAESCFVSFDKDLNDLTGD
ncbi:MAG: hypothetical protein IJH82_11995 [Lachnospiraceae bacterium]|nr:hypothetical protein [Lachnospiraceae bacterium]